MSRMRHMDLSNDFDVLLVNPRNPPSGSAESAEFTCENLALAYLSSALATAGARTLIVDCDLDKVGASEIAALCERERPVLVGITALSRNAGDAIEIAREVKRRCPGTRTVLGGLHFTYCGEKVLAKVPEIDFVIRGEGEFSMIALYRYLKDGVGTRLQIGGLLYRSQDGSVVRIPATGAIENLDALPFPDRQVLARAVRKGIQPAIPVLSSRGCYARCLFCNASHVYNEGGGRPWRHRSASNVVDEIEGLVDRYAADADPVILFYDDTFIGPGNKARRHAYELADEIIRRDVRIMFETFLRADTFHDDYELVRRLREAGMVRVFMGIEASDDQELKLFRKAVTVHQIDQALDNLKTNNVTTPSSGFIMFLPYSSFTSLRRNALYLRKIHHASVWNLSTRLDVYGGNEFVPYLREQGLLTGADEYDGVYEYKFRDARVARFAAYMDISQNDVVQRLDTVGRFVEFNFANMSYELSRIGIACDWDESALIDRAQKDIQTLAFDFFMNAMERFERNDPDIECGPEKDRFFDTLSERIDALESSYARFLARANAALEGRGAPAGQAPAESAHAA
ncbi:radical SAM protein [Burkholderia stagnalis]|nr:radical SAM protein [Burkholderia stagnalis]RQY05155.1 radical SAM protein [Burkholderia stagnalis]RQY22654.1 radical SAM protein [Burkholderia stagnalis]RQY35691.1 radical SAM protein [Burkholderia stagnalis]